MVTRIKLVFLLAVYLLSNRPLTVSGRDERVSRLCEMPSHNREMYMEIRASCGSVGGVCKSAFSDAYPNDIRHRNYLPKVFRPRKCLICHQISLSSLVRNSEKF